VRSISGAGSSPVSGIFYDKWRHRCRSAFGDGISVTLGSRGGRILAMLELQSLDLQLERPAADAPPMVSPSGLEKTILPAWIICSEEDKIAHRSSP
jgi:hypothetical protein